MTANIPAEDSEELEAVFDSIGAANLEADAQTGSAGAEFNPPLLRSGLSADRVQRIPSSQPPALPRQSSDVINQIGLVTRTLHDALRELGLNKKIEKTASSIPDATDRLNYEATLTQQAARSEE